MHPRQPQTALKRVSLVYTYPKLKHRLIEPHFHQEEQRFVGQRLHLSSSSTASERVYCLGLGLQYQQPLGFSATGEVRWVIREISMAPDSCPACLSEAPCAGKIPNALADVDRKCLAAERPEHVTTTIPESQRQKTAAVLFQDVALFHTPWAFNVSEIRPEIRRATHIWQASPCSPHIIE